MKKKLTKALIVSLVLIITLAMPVFFVFASDITLSQWFGTIIIHNDSSTPNSSVTVNITNISTTELQAHGYANATVNNTSMRNSSGADAAFMPGLGSSPWMTFVPTITADGYIAFILYTDLSTGGKMAYFPGASGMEVADNASLEPSDNFSINQQVWVDTSAGPGKFLTSKPGCMRIAVSPDTDGDIEVWAYGINGTCLDFKRPNGDWVRIPDDAAFSFTDGIGNDEPFTFIAWVNFDDATDSSLITKRIGAQNEWHFTTDAADNLEVALMDLAGGNNINAETAAITGDQGAWHHYAATYDGSELNTGLELYRDGTNATNARGGAGAYVGMADGTSNVDVGTRAAGAAQLMDGQMAEMKVYNAELTITEVLADYNGEHRTADLVAWWRMVEGVGLPQDSSGNAHHANQNLADWIATFTERFSVFLTATGITADKHFVEVYADSVNASISVDGNLEDSAPLGGYTFPNTGGNWIFVRAAAVRYMETHEVIKGGNQVQYISWEYDTVFHDQSIAGTNDAYPTFATSGSDPNVTGNLTYFSPVSEAKAPPFVLGEGPAFFTTAPNITATFTTVPPTAAFPFAWVVESIASATATPPQLPLLLIGIFAILAFSLTTSYTFRKYGSGSLIPKIAVITAMMALFAPLGFGFDFWMLVCFLILAIGIAIMSRHSWA